MATPSNTGGTGGQQRQHPRPGAQGGGAGSFPHQGGGRPGSQQGLAAGMAEAAGQVKEKVQDLASGAADRLEDAWDSTRQGVQQAASTAARTFEDAFQDVRAFLGRYPVASVGAAFALGCLVGRLMAFRTVDMTRQMSRASD